MIELAGRQPHAGLQAQTKMAHSAVVNLQSLLLVPGHGDKALVASWGFEEGQGTETLDGVTGTKDAVNFAGSTHGALGTGLKFNAFSKPREPSRGVRTSACATPSRSRPGLRPDPAFVVRPLGRVEAGRAEARTTNEGRPEGLTTNEGWRADRQPGRLPARLLLRAGWCGQPRPPAFHRRPMADLRVAGQAPRGAMEPRRRDVRQAVWRVRLCERRGDRPGRLRPARSRPPRTPISSSAATAATPGPSAAPSTRCGSTAARWPPRNCGSTSRTALASLEPRLRRPSSRPFTG